MAPGGDDGFRLEILLDASGVRGIEPDRTAKVLALDGEGHAYEATVRFDAGGKGMAALHLAEAPGDLRVVVGPENASTEELKGIRTLCVEVPPDRWDGSRTLRLPPIAISGFYWWWWLAPPLARQHPFLE